jgi:transcriptional regulator with XRE-family HTH domain
MISEFIKGQRIKNGMTQQALADKLHFQQATISMWERGERNPAIEILPQLADIFGCSIDALFGRA